MRAHILTLIIMLLSANIGLWAEERDSVATDSITKSLKEVEITAQTVTHQGNHDAYIVTKEMKEGLHSAGELLSRIPEIQYNPLTQAVKYLGSSNIVILMDSLEKSTSFIKNLSPNRFDRIDVVHNPTGKYTGYDVLINFHTRPLYEGYSGYAHTQLMWYPRNRKLNDGGFGKIPLRGGLSYTREKWSFDISATYEKNNSYNMGYYSKYYIENDRKEETLEQDKNNPGIRSSNRFLNANMSVDYRIDQNHVLAARWGIGTQDGRTETNQRIAIDDHPALLTDTIDYHSDVNKNNSMTNSFGLYYFGRIGSWNLNTTATYTISGWDTCNDIARSDGYAQSDYRDISSRYFWGGITLFRAFNNNRWQTSLTEYVTALDYSEDRIGGGMRLTDNSVTQNNILASVAFNATQRLSVSFNGGAYYFRDSEGGRYVESWSPRLYADLLWRPSNKVVARLNYSLNSSMPALSLISSHGQFTDSLEYQAGNPMLDATKRHNLTFTLLLFNSLSFKGSYQRATDAYYNIESLDYLPLPDGSMMPYAFSRYENGRSEQWMFGVYYNKRLSSHFEISASAEIMKQIAGYNQYRQEKWIPSTDIMLTYRHNPIGLAVYLNYALYSPHTIITPQSIVKDRYEGVSIAATKKLWKNRLDLVFMWYLPLGDRYVKGYHLSPAIEKSSWNDDGFRSYNILSIGCTLRFNGGDKVRKMRLDTYDIEE